MIVIDTKVPSADYNREVGALCGMDEAGRGPLAGPLVAAAVILPDGFDFAARFPKVAFRDSKKLSRLQREKAFDLIRTYAVSYQIVQIEVAEINQHGIGVANKAIFEALLTLIQADHYIVDGNLRLTIPVALWGRVESRVRADESVAAVSAASILAKVQRDRLMSDLDLTSPQYGWRTNRGYGTASHIRAIREFGRSVHHRTQFVDTALSDKTLKRRG